MSLDHLRARLGRAGLGEVAGVTGATGGFAAQAALVRLRSGREVFAGWAPTDR